MSDELSIGEVAARSGVAVSAMHFYERRGLIGSHRTAGNQRRYARDVLRRIAVIRVAQEIGIPLAEIAAAFAALPDGRTPNRGGLGQALEGLGGLARSPHRAARQAARRADRLHRLRLHVDRPLSAAQSDDRLARQGPGPHRLRAGPQPMPRRPRKPGRRKSAGSG